MAILYQTIKNLSKDAHKQILIQELYEYGITELHGQDLYDLDYSTLRSLVARERIKRGQ